jgi:hypothetical protein
VTSRIPSSWAVPAEISAEDQDPPPKWRALLQGGALVAAGGVLGALVLRQAGCMEPPTVAQPVAVAAPIVAVVAPVAPVVEPAVVAPSISTTTDDGFSMPGLPSQRRAKVLAAQGHAKLEANKDGPAIVLLEQAIALDPTLANAWRDVAVARLRRGDTAGAKAAATRYARLAPGDESASLLRSFE